jgi:hypothetical protein
MIVTSSDLSSEAFAVPPSAGLGRIRSTTPINTSTPEPLSTAAATLLPRLVAS